MSAFYMFMDVDGEFILIHPNIRWALPATALRHDEQFYYYKTFLKNKCMNRYDTRISLLQITTPTVLVTYNITAHTSKMLTCIS